MSAGISSVTMLLGPTPGRSSNVGRSVAAEAPPPVHLQQARTTRSSSSFDQASGRVVTVVVRASDGSVVAQTPDPQALRVLAGIREMVGAAVDELV